MFKNNDTVLALDMGSASIKAVELGYERGKLVLHRAVCADLPLPTDGDRAEGRPESLPRLITAIGDILSQMNLKPAKVKRLISNLPSARISIKQIKSLALPDEEMRSALVFEARKHMPVEGDVLMDYQVLGKRGEELDVLLVVTTKQAVTSHLALLEACGFAHARTSLIEAPALALWNAYLKTHPKLLETPAQGKSSPIGFLNLGATTSHLSFFHQDGLFLTRDIPIGGDKFTDDMRQSHNLDFAAAERQKTSEGFFRSEKSSTGHSVATLELEGEGGRGQPSLQALVREIQRSIRFYLKESGQTRLETLVLAGGGAADPGIQDHLQRELGLNVDIFNPIENLEMRAGFKLPTPQRFAQALGMGIRGVHEFFPH